MRTCELGNKQGQANGDWCDEGRLLLLSGYEQYRDDQLDRQKHFDE